jgi:four helix bundle protein
MSENRENVVQQKSFDFAVIVVQLCYRLRDSHEYVLSKQLMRSGTSIGANIEEALGGQSRSDFVSKMSIARKEARETRYWLRILKASAIIDLDVSRELGLVEELLRLLTAIIKSTKDNQ